MIAITLPGRHRQTSIEGTTALDVATSISEGLARNVLPRRSTVRCGIPAHPSQEIQPSSLLTSRDDEGMSTLWHSSAHLMAEALESLYPGVKFWVGPPVENGFYYDVDFGEHTFTDADIPAVEKR